MKKFLLLSCMLFFAYAGNSQCTADAVLAIDATCTGTTGGANSGDPTGNDPIDVNPCNGSYAGGDDYIFSYTATTNDALQLDLETTNAWSGLMVTDACPDDAAAACVGSSTSSFTMESLTTGALTPGTTYYIHISTWPTPQSPGQFCLNAALVPAATPPANDDCPNATALTVNADLNCATVTPGTIEAATPSPEDPTACSGTENNDVWFSFVATNATHHIDLLNPTGGTTDLYHSVWAGPCGATATNLSCSDPNNSVVSGLTVGTTYYLRVYSWNASDEATTFDVCIGTPPSPPPNDDCANAAQLTVDTDMCGTPTIGTNLSATDSGIAHSCASYSGGDVWYAVMVPQSGNVNIEVSAAGGFTDGGMEAYSDCAGTSIECDDDDGPGLLPYLELTGQTPGAIIYIAVWEYGNNAFGDFAICAWEPPACAVPTSIATANVTETTVDVSWVSGAIMTSSEVQVCPAGAPAGDPTCIVVNPAVSPATVSGLTACTDYDVYVQDICGQDMTIYEGPVSFSTTGPAPDLMPACGSTITYPACPGAPYTSNENITWTLCASPTDVAEITFTYVDIETSGFGDLCYDEITITYSDGSMEPVNCGEPDGDGGVGTGLAAGSTFTDMTPGGCMTVTFTSDGSVQETGFAFDFACVTPCDAPSQLVLVNSGATVVSSPTDICANANGWTYYEDPGAPGTYVFAIKWGTMNTAARAAATVTVTQAAAMGMAEGGTPGVAGDATWTMERYWDVDLGAATLGAPVDVRFYYDPAEKTAVDNAVTGDGRPVITQDWFTILTPTIGMENSITYAEFPAIASFSGGTYAGTVSQAVPIDLVSIKGTPFADHNRISWETGSEVNNDYQAIERSSDGRNDWKEIGRVAGKNTQEVQAYSLKDDMPLKETYYRLKSVDFNGATQYSEVVTVNRISFSNLRSTISPNPFTSDLQVMLESDSDQRATISVFSLDGKVLLQTSVQLNNSVAHYENLDLTELQTGIYLLQVKMGDYNETRRIVKVQ